MAGQPDMQKIQPVRRCRFTAGALLVLAMAAGLSAPVLAQQSPAESETYLSELLSEPRHARAWRNLLKGERDLDAWLVNYARTRNGPTAPEDDVLIEGRRYRGHMVCKTHDCGANRFFVLFAPDASQAWGLLLRSGQAQRFLGQPDAAMQDALSKLARL